MLIAGAVELGMEGLQELLLGLAIRGLEGWENLLFPSGTFPNPFQPQRHCVPPGCLACTL